MNANGFAGMVPIARVREIAADGRRRRGDARSAGTAASTTTRSMPFAQFGVDADTVFTVCDEFTRPARPAQGVPGEQGRLRRSAASSPRTGSSRSATRCR